MNAIKNLPMVKPVRAVSSMEEEDDVVTYYDDMISMSRFILGSWLCL